MALQEQVPLTHEFYMRTIIYSLNERGWSFFSQEKRSPSLKADRKIPGFLKTHQTYFWVPITGNSDGSPKHRFGVCRSLHLCSKSVLPPAEVGFVNSDIVNVMNTTPWNSGIRRDWNSRFGAQCEQANCYVNRVHGEVQRLLPFCVFLQHSTFKTVLLNLFLIPNKEVLEK